MSETPTEQRIRIMPDGPYLVMGAVPLTERYPAESRHGEPLAWDPVGAPEEMVAPRATYALCRCGQSGPKPFCDGTHARVGFDGTVTAERGTPPHAGRDGHRDDRRAGTVRAYRLLRDTPDQRLGDDRAHGRSGGARAWRR